jgi:hypothetical protein
MVTRIEAILPKMKNRPPVKAVLSTAYEDAPTDLIVRQINVI